MILEAQLPSPSDSIADYRHHGIHAPRLNSFIKEGLNSHTLAKCRHVKANFNKFERLKTSAMNATAITLRASGLPPQALAARLADLRVSLPPIAIEIMGNIAL
jgi:hypothetical protein